MRRKGRYVAQIVIDIDMDDADRHYADFDRMENIMKAGELTELIKHHVTDFTFAKGISTVEVTPTYIDLYRVADNSPDYRRLSV